MMIDHVSNSMHNLWCKCGVAFEFSYLKWIKLPGTAAMYRGGAMHVASEVNFKQKLKTKEDLPLNDLKDACRDSFVKSCKKGILIPKVDRWRKNDLLNTELNSSIKNTECYSKEIAPKIMPAIVEKKLSYDLGLDLPLVGVLDVADVNHVITDLKSTEKKKPKGWEHKELQPSFYTPLYKAYTDIWPKFEYHIIKKGEDDVRDSTRTETDCKQLLARIDIFIKSIQTGIFKPAEPGHWICSEKWCGYWPLCKYAQK